MTLTRWFQCLTSAHILRTETILCQRFLKMTKETTYNYSRENGYLKSKTEPQGKTTSYSYSATGNLTKSSVALSENSSLDATYGYDNLGRITSIGHNDFHYIISYNTWGNVSRVMVGLSGLLTGKCLLIILMTRVHIEIVF